MDRVVGLFTFVWRRTEFALKNMYQPSAATWREKMYNPRTFGRDKEMQHERMPRYLYFLKLNTFVTMQVSECLFFVYSQWWLFDLGTLWRMLKVLWRWKTNSTKGLHQPSTS